MSASQPQTLNSGEETMAGRAASSYCSLSYFFSWSETPFSSISASSAVFGTFFEYKFNAPSSPDGHSTCLSVIQVINNAIQFCGLRAIFNITNSQGQLEATLESGSWAQNVDFCVWRGVSSASVLIVSL
ncbi:hypothetical protein JVU11DRAFT_7473 [Chiua virens]|nr:hypothetical protein JVU11DRAFT_7473 [Chiua virens]